MPDVPWRYQFPLPVADYRTSRASIQPGFCVDLKGVDARHTGSLRLFPGMKTAHEGTSSPTGSQVNFFKTFSFLYGNTTLHGYAYRTWQDPSTTLPGHQNLVFRIYNPAVPEWRTVHWPLRGVNNTIDIAVNGKYIHIAEEGYPGVTWWYDPGFSTKNRQFGPVRTPVIASGVLTSTGGIGKIFGNNPNNIFKTTSGSPYLGLRIDSSMGIRLVDTLRGTASPLATRDTFVDVVTPYPSPAPTSFPYDEFFTLTNTRSAGYLLVDLNAVEMANYDRIELWRTVTGTQAYYLSSYWMADDYSISGGAPARPFVMPSIGNMWGTLGFVITGATFAAGETTLTTGVNAFLADMKVGGATPMALFTTWNKSHHPITDFISTTSVKVAGDQTYLNGQYCVLTSASVPIYQEAIGYLKLPPAITLVGPNSQLETTNNVFTSQMATEGWTVRFPATKREYTIIGYTSPTVATVAGNATSEDGVMGNSDITIIKPSRRILAWYGIFPGVGRMGVPAGVQDIDVMHRFYTPAEDSRLMYSTAYDWTMDASGPPPYGGLLAYSGGLCVKNSQGTLDSRQRGDVCFSNTYQLEGENFPTGNVLSPPSGLRGDMHSIVAAGSFFFVMGKSGVYRMSRVGATVGGQPIVKGWGPVNRWASTVIDNVLAMVTPSSLVLMNTSDGKYQTVGAVERVIQEDWKGDHETISLAYDSRMSVLVILNGAKHEALLVWLTTNSVTKLTDVSARMVTSGTDFYGSGQQRAYFMYDGTDKFTVLEFDSFRDGGYPNMAGLDNTIPLAGTLVNASGTNLSAAELGLASTTVRYKGFYIYIIEPNGTAHRRLITNASGSSITLQSTAPYAGSKWIIAPVVFEVVGWPVETEDSPPRNLFTRRKILSVGASVDIKSTTFYGANPDNLHAWAETFRRLENEPTNIRKIPALSNETDGNYGSVLTSGPLLCPGFKVLTAGVDFELLGLVAHGTIEETEKNTG